LAGRLSFVSIAPVGCGWKAAYTCRNNKLERKMRLISFQTRKGQSIFVNPSQVRFVLSIGTDSKIEFGPDHSVLVTTGAEAVKSM
jgi:hypothetical protein